MLACDHETHLAREVVVLAVRALEHADIAPGQADRVAAGDGQWGAIDGAPIGQFGRAGGDRRCRNQQREPAAGRAESVHPGQPRREQRTAAQQREQQVGGHHQRMPPRRDRLERGVDHRGAGHGEQRAGDRRHAHGDAERVAVQRRRIRARRDQVWQQQCAERERRHVGQQRHHAFARQPRAAPLRHRPPCAQRLAQVRERAEQADGDHQQCQHQQEQQGSRSRALPQHGHGDRGEQAIAGAGQGGEEDDRERGVHISVP